ASDDHRQAAVELAAGVRGERPLGQVSSRLARGDAEHPQGHRPRRALRQIAGLQPDEQARSSDERLPDDRQLRPLLWSRDMYADAAGRVAARVTGTGLITDPGPCADVVEVACREGEVHGLVDLTGAVRAE